MAIKAWDEGRVILPAVAALVISCAANALAAPPPVGFVMASNVGCQVGRANIQPGDSVVWLGPCIEGLAQGAGTAQWSSGGRPTLRYEGSFSRGLLEGKGRMRGSDGDLYEGDFKSGLRHGHGIYVAANGARYEGAYRDNQRAADSPVDTAARAQAAALEGKPTAAPIARDSGAGNSPERAMIGRCKDETRQGQLGPFRQQIAVVWALVAPDVANAFAQAPVSAADLALTDSILSASAPIVTGAIRLAAAKCGVALPRDPKTQGAASVQVLLFRDRLPAGGPIRPEEREANFRNEDLPRLVAAVVSSDGARFGFGNHSDPTTQSQLRASQEASRRSEAAKSGEADEQRRMAAFFAKHGVTGLVDERALQTNPFALEGKIVVVPARFVEMLSASKMVMNMPRAQYFVLSDAPRDGLSYSDDFIVVGKVLGNTNFEGNSFKSPVPHLKFIAFQKCKKYPFEGCF